jgi:hypothetical protein
MLLAVSTLTHQPSPATEFAAYAAYVTTTPFLISHLVASIVGAAVGVIGFVSLAALLLLHGRSPRSAASALGIWILGNTLSTSVFGVAAFAQPAIGRAYQAGLADQAIAFNNDVYNIPLFATALPGLLLFAVGVTLFGIAAARSKLLPKWSGIGLAVGGPMFAMIGFLIGDVQPFAAALIAASTAWMALSAGHQRVSTVSQTLAHAA